MKGFVVVIRIVGPVLVSIGFVCLPLVVRIGWFSLTRLIGIIELITIAFHCVSNSNYLAPQVFGIFPLSFKFLFVFAKLNDSFGNLSNRKAKIFIILGSLIVNIRFNVAFELFSHNSHELD